VFIEIVGVVETYYVAFIEVVGNEKVKFVMTCVY